MNKTDFHQIALENGRKAMQALMDNIHASSHCTTDVVEGMLDLFTREHRTIQQETIKVFVQMLNELAKCPEARVSDLRNEASYRFAQEVAKMNVVFPYIQEQRNGRN